MNVKCSKCNKDAIIFQKYSGMHLCKKHFIEDVERKIKLTIRKHFNVQKNDIIAIALSGGKDSAVLLYMLHKIFGMRPDIELVAITIDEGIEGYREHTLKTAKELTARLGVRHIIRSFDDEFNTSLDEIIAKEREKGACSYCGVLRKTLLNKSAIEVGATKLATGHNLDDEAQTILLNHLRGEVSRIVKLAQPRALEGLVLRAKPLRYVPEKEVALYALVNDLPVDFSECPYAHEAIRGEVRDMLNDFEVAHPGTKYSLLKGFDKISPIISKEYTDIELAKCSICGEPCSLGICQACRLLGRE
ncbi:MAG TPA: TIGR00269 family protein [Methanosarcinaceae archaeon]|nr:TIGR00269 family protein [Methanosarcinaceae archaeon]